MASSSPFASYLNAVAPRQPAMPLMHSTDLIALRSMLDVGTLATSQCGVFGEDLLYLFYGRPAYRVAQMRQSRTDAPYSPVCLVLRPDVIASPKRVYPFDSGAFEAGMFKSYLHESMGRESFLLGSSVDLPPRAVEAFFGSNRSYYFGEAKAGLSFDMAELEVKAYYDLVSAVGELDHDDRRFTIEVQSPNGVLLSANVLAVVCPLGYLESKDVRETIVARWKATPLPYALYKATRPIEYHGLVREMVREFLEARGYL